MIDPMKLCREVRHQLTTHRYDPHYDHPINQSISSLIDTGQNEMLLFLVITNIDKPSFLASILQAMRFASKDKLEESHYELVNKMLSQESLIVRSAAVDLLESWGTEPALARLRGHLPFEKVKWLADYIQRVLHE